MNNLAPQPSAEHEIYLLRVWYEFDGSTPVWRCSLLLPHAPQRRYFAAPEALLHFLAQQVQLRHAPAGSKTETP